MAEKKAVLVLAGKASISNAAIGKKGVFVPYTAGDVLTVAEKVEGAAKVDAAGVAAEMEKETAFVIVDLGAADDAALDAALEKVLDAADRKTIIGVVGADKFALYGQGVAKGAAVKNGAVAADVVPTLAYVADAFLPVGLEEGRVLYAALKDPNARLKEIGKMQESLKSMQAAMTRDTHEPWDKHDCA